MGEVIVVEVVLVVVVVVVVVLAFLSVFFSDFFSVFFRYLGFLEGVFFAVVGSTCEFPGTPKNV